jgi:hypothetical protein
LQKRSDLLGAVQPGSLWLSLFEAPRFPRAVLRAISSRSTATSRICASLVIVLLIEVGDNDPWLTFDWR